MNVLRTLGDTQALAEKLARRLRRGDVVTLAGDLGAGKTTFAQFLIRALSVGDVDVTSPTFTLLQTYPVTLADGAACELFHYDLYRIEHASALTELGLEEALQGCVILEWPQRLQGYRYPAALALSFALGEDATRIVTAAGDAARWGDLLA
jgi:tRNA threonylcarbamoyl adenosine modification protein YjeE